MKKVLSLLTVAILTSSSVASSVAFTKYKIKYNKKNIKKPNFGTGDYDYNIFNRGYYADITTNHKAQDPSKVDININNYYNNKDDNSLKNSIYKDLDKKYQNYEANFYNIDQHVVTGIFSEINKNDEEIQFEDPKNNESNTYLDFKIENLNNLNIYPNKVGEWYTYNLKLINILNNTSFEFSLNLCNFNTDKISYNALPSMINFNDEYSAGVHVLDTHITNTNSSTVFNINSLKFSNIDQASFFLSPFLYTYHYHTSIHFYNFPPSSYHPDISSANWPNKGTASQYINFSNISSTFNNSLDNQGLPEDYSNLVNSDGCIVNHKATVNLYAFNNIWYTSDTNKTNIHILFRTVGWSDHYDACSGHSWRLYINYLGDSLTGFYNMDVFNIENIVSYEILNNNSITDYIKFMRIGGLKNSNYYSYKSDILNKYYTYAIKQNKDGRGVLYFDSNNIDVYTFELTNGTQTYTNCLDSYSLNELFVDKPMKWTVSFTPKNLNDLSLYYGVGDSKITFNIIVYPSTYSTFHNYIDYNKVDNNKNLYNRDLKIHIDGNLVTNRLSTTDNIDKLNEDDSTGLLQVINNKYKGWNWFDYKNDSIHAVIYDNIYKWINKYFTNPNDLVILNKQQNYTEGLMMYLSNYVNTNIYIDIKFNLNNDQFSNSSIYNNFENKNPNTLFYKQLIFNDGLS